MSACTNTREPAQHTCPWLKRIPNCNPSIAISHLQSSKNMFADLPPNSRVHGINLSALASATPQPTSVEPVNANLLKSGWSKMYCPDLEPLPVITLNTPLGITFCVNLANSSTLNGVELDGLNTVQHPA